jgi:hypothetical protein
MTAANGHTFCCHLPPPPEFRTKSSDPGTENVETELLEVWTEVIDVFRSYKLGGPTTTGGQPTRQCLRAAQRRLVELYGLHRPEPDAVPSAEYVCRLHYEIFRFW